jgi:cell division protease FtsH
VADVRRPPFRFDRRFALVLLALLIANAWIVSTVPERPQRLQVPYTFFRSQVAGGNVRDVTARGDAIQGDFRRPAAPASAGRPVIRFQTQRPSFADDGLIRLLLARHVVVNARPIDSGRSSLATAALSVLPTLLFFGLLLWLMSRASRMAAGGLGAFGRSRARRYAPAGARVTFADVAGIDEAKEELAEVVDFLRNPDRYRRLGAAIPRGVLLYGPPGTGKTLLARAVAGEADVAFFSTSAAEFIEMIVGVGASRVRDLFEEAKKHEPAIVFIDELDAIGRARGGAGAVGGHDEREQTLNQILTEMDGFTGNEGVIVIGATNRPEVLDPALLRPGRFDRRVAVSAPDRDGRRAILEVHTRSVPLAPDVKLDRIAANTPGMVGAELRNLVNEAALTAARRNHAAVAAADFADALEKLLLGGERRILLSDEDRRLTAYHESGHALIGMLIPGADPVRKVSIVPRGRALGVTFQTPEDDRYGYGVEYLQGRLAGLLGGRAAEELVFGDVTTGAESDLEQATRIARQMVGRWGMSERVGLVSVLPGPQDEPLLLGGSDAPAGRTRDLVDDEVRRITGECHDRALALLRENRPRLDRLAAALLERETLDEDDAYRTAGIPRRRGADVVELAARVAARSVGQSALSDAGRGLPPRT